MQLPRKLCRGIFIVGALVLLSPGSLAAQPWDPEALIVWQDERREVALFVPEALLLRSVALSPGNFSLDGVPMDPSLGDGFTSYVKRYVRNYAPGARLLYLLMWPMCEEGALSDSKVFLESLRRSQLVALGRVVSSQPGLKVIGPIMVASRQFLLVERVLSGDTDQVGKVISFLQGGGRLNLYEIELANSTDDQGVAEVGSQVIFAGRYLSNAADVWLPTAVLDVSGGQVHPPSCVEGRGRSGWSVEELRASLKAPSGGF